MAYSSDPHKRHHKCKAHLSCKHKQRLSVDGVNLLSCTTCSHHSQSDNFRIRWGVTALPVREVDPREVTARMDSAIVKAVLGMEIPKDLVQKAIKKRLAENGEDFTSAEALLEAVFNLSHQRDGETESDMATRELKDDLSLSGALSSGSDPDSLRLAEENRQLKEQRQCKICMDEEVCVAFIPCGHLVCCSTCAPALNQCPICRAKIKGTIRTYMS